MIKLDNPKVCPECGSHITFIHDNIANDECFAHERDYKFVSTIELKWKCTDCTAHGQDTYRLSGRRWNEK